jgi:hypothetical protein
MSEMVDKKRKDKADEKVPVESGPVEIEGMEEFTPDEITRLLEVKQAVAAGRYTDITNEHRKLLFVQWLIEHDRLKS